MMIELEVFGTNRPCYLNPLLIQSIVLEQGMTSITMMSGEEWGVSESPQSVAALVDEAYQLLRRSRI